MSPSIIVVCGGGLSNSVILQRIEVNQPQNRVNMNNRYIDATLKLCLYDTLLLFRE